MRRLIKTALAAAGAAALMATTLNAHADVRVYDDPKGDSGTRADIRTTFIDYGQKLIVVVHYPGSSMANNNLRYYIDTDRSDVGPEYLATVYPNSDVFGITKVENWKRPNQGTPVHCPGFRALADGLNRGPKRTNVRIPARCIGAPDAVRVAVWFKKGASSDWARGYRQLPALGRPLLTLSLRRELWSKWPASRPAKRDHFGHNSRGAVRVGQLAAAGGPFAQGGDPLGELVGGGDRGGGPPQVRRSSAWMTPCGLPERWCHAATIPLSSFRKPDSRSWADCSRGRPRDSRFCAFVRARTRVEAVGECPNDRSSLGGALTVVRRQRPSALRHRR